MNRSMQEERGVTPLAAVVALILLTGCFVFPSDDPDLPPDVVDEGCSNDHASHWKPDPIGAQLEFDGTPADSECNQAPWFEGGGAQGGDVFHFEPQLRVTSETLDRASEPALEWELVDMNSGEVVELGFVEVYDDDIEREETGFVVTTRARIPPERRGKNFIVRMRMEVYDPTAVPPDPYYVPVVVEAAVYLSQ